MLDRLKAEYPGCDCGHGGFAVSIDIHRGNEKEEIGSLSIFASGMLMRGTESVPFLFLLVFMMRQS
jgi:hypothetical protein